MTEPPFAPLLTVCDDDTSITLSNGARFIRKLPEDRSLGYLHKLFAPLPAAGVHELQAELGQRLPPQVCDFLSWSNGATLFDNKLYLLGYPKAFSRSLELEDQSALSLLEENQIFEAVAPDRWERGWTRVGSMVGWDSALSIEVHIDGGCEVRGEADGIGVYSSFDECLTTATTRLGSCFSCDGLTDMTYAELEAALTSLVAGSV